MAKVKALREAHMHPQGSGCFSVAVNTLPGSTFLILLSAFVVYFFVGSCDQCL